MADEYKEILGRVYCHTLAGVVIADFQYPLYTMFAINPTTSKRKRPTTRTISNGTSRYGLTVVRNNKYMTPFIHSDTMNVYTVHQVTGGEPIPKNFDPGGEISKSFATELMNKLRSDFRGEHINLANMMAEYAQTASMFSQNAERIAMAFKALKAVASARKKALGLLLREPKGSSERSIRNQKRRQEKASKRIDKRAAQAHLEITYGVLPLVGDLNAALKAIRKGPNAVFKTITARASRHSFIYGEESYPANTKLARLPKGALATVTKHVQKYRTYVAEAGITNGSLLAGLGNYGLTNPIATAWELIPFSFVVDWHINVGEVLASLDSAVYFTGATYQATTKTIEQGTQTCYGGTASTTRRSYYRSAPAALSLVAEFRYKPSISKQHIVNGVALLRSLAK